MKKVLHVLILSVVTFLIVAGCSENNDNSSSNDNDKVQAVATYSIIYDIVKQVGGDFVEVSSLAPIGSDPHEYDPLPADVRKTQDADVVFYNGINLETGNSWFENLLETVGKSGEDAPVYMLSEGIEVRYLTESGNEGETDPHAWLDLRNGIIYAENARDALSEIDPENAETYEQNAADYIAEIESLHEDALERFQEIPENERFLVTSEGAFMYFGDAYGIDTGYIWEINSENEGTPQQITSIVEQIRDRQPKGVFLETSVDERSMQMVANEAGVEIVGTVFTDSLAQQGEPGDSYLSMMKHNIDTIVEGLK